MVSITGETNLPFLVPGYCEANQDNAASPIHCVPINRFAPDNQNIGAIFIASRNVVVKGTNRTDGISLVILAENLIMAEGHDKLDLSAPQDPAPTLASTSSVCSSTECTEGSIFEAFGTQLSEIFSLDGTGKLQPSPNFPDVVWQYERARQLLPDHEWPNEHDPCKDSMFHDDVQRLGCVLDREARGLAGLAGGSLFAMTHRFNGFNVESRGQPGGNGGPGYVSEFRGMRSVCSEFVHHEVFNTAFCQYSYEVPLDGCHRTNKFPLDGQPEPAACRYACSYDRSTMGQPGGHAGPGGAAGLATLVAINALSVCNKGPFLEEKLREEGGSDTLDAQCIDGIANDRSPDLVDCDSPFCKDNPDVTVCPPGPTLLPDRWKRYGDVIAKFIRPEITPNGEQESIPLSLVDARTAVRTDGKIDWTLRLDQERFLRLREGPWIQGRPTKPEMPEELIVQTSGTWPDDLEQAAQQPDSVAAKLAAGGFSDAVNNYLVKTDQPPDTSVRYHMLVSPVRPGYKVLIDDHAGTTLLDFDGEVVMPEMGPEDQFQCRGSVEFKPVLIAGVPGVPGQGSLHKMESCRHISDNFRACVTLTSPCDLLWTIRPCSYHGPYVEVRRGGFHSATCNHVGEGGPDGLAPEPVVALHNGVSLGWARQHWAAAIDRLLPLEWSRRIAQGDARFKSGEVEASSVPYMSVLNALTMLHNGACGDGVTTGDAHTDYLCGLDADVRRHLNDRIHFRNYYGYPKNFLPPVAARTHRLRELLDSTLDNVAAQEQRWVDMGSIAALTSQMAQQRAHDLDVEKCELIRSTVCATSLDELPSECRGEIGSPAPAPDGCGVLRQQLMDADATVAERREALRKIKSMLASLQWSQQQLQDPETGMFDTLMTIAEAMATAAATASGGALAGLAADEALRAVASAGVQPGKEKVEQVSSQTYDECLKAGQDGGPSAIAECTSKANAKAGETESWLAPDGATWSSALEDGAEAAGKKAFEETIKLALSGDSDTVAKSMDQHFLDAAIREWMWRAYESGIELGRAVRQREIVRAKISAARGRIWQLQADKLAVHQAYVSGGGSLPPVAVQLQIADAAFRSAARVVERAGEHVFLYRRAIERDTLPFDAHTGESRLRVLEQHELASPNGMLYAACNDVDVDGFSLDVTVRNWPCYKMWAAWLGLFADANGPDSTSFIDVTVPVEDSDFDEDRNAWRIPVTLGVDDIKAASAEWGTHTRAKIKDFFVRLDTSAGPVTGTIPIVIERGPENIFYLGTHRAMPDLTGSNPNQQALVADRLYTVEYGKRPASEPLLVDLLMTRPDHYRHEMHACHSQSMTDPSAHPFCWASENNVAGESGETGRSWLDGESVVGELIVEVPQSQLDAFGATLGAGNLTPIELRVHLTYEYRHIDADHVTPN